MVEDKVTRVNKECLCGFCGNVAKESENCCSKKCQELHEISESIQKINYCVEILRGKFDLKSDHSMDDVLRILEKNSITITKNIKSIQNPAS